MKVFYYSDFLNYLYVSTGNFYSERWLIFAWYLKLLWSWRYMMDNVVVILKKGVIDDAQLGFVE